MHVERRRRPGRRRSSRRTGRRARSRRAPAPAGLRLRTCCGAGARVEKASVSGASHSCHGQEQTADLLADRGAARLPRHDTDGEAAPRRPRASERAWVVLPAPSVPSKHETPDTGSVPYCRPVSGRSRRAVGLAASAARTEVVAVSELVLQPADVGRPAASARSAARRRSPRRSPPPPPHSVAIGSIVVRSRRGGWRGADIEERVPGRRTAIGKSAAQHVAPSGRPVFERRT